MKNQMDLILSGVAIFIALVVSGFFYATARKPAGTPPVDKVNVSAVVAPTFAVPMTAGIAGASTKGGGGGGAGRGGGGGGGGSRRGG